MQLNFEIARSRPVGGGGGNSASARADALLCAILRGENASWPASGDDDFPEIFLRRAEYHGITVLLHERLSHLLGCPAPTRSSLHERSIGSAIWDLRHQRILSLVHSELAKIDIQPLLFKGTSLAYGMYKSPWLRMRGDTDMLVPLQERQTVQDVLRRLGFEKSFAVGGEFVSYQASFIFDAPDQSSHVIDLHWKINNSEVLSNLFLYEDLLRHAVHLPGLCCDAMAVGPVHALLLACMHRQVHVHSPYYVEGIAYLDADRLIWLYDIHLLAELLSMAQWQEVIQIATAKEMQSVCLAGIRAAMLCFHTACPEFVLDALSDPANRRTARPLSRLRQAPASVYGLYGPTGPVRKDAVLAGACFSLCSLYA